MTVHELLAQAEMLRAQALEKLDLECALMDEHIRHGVPRQLMGWEREQREKRRG